MSSVEFEDQNNIYQGTEKRSHEEYGAITKIVLSVGLVKNQQAATWVLACIGAICFSIAIFVFVHVFTSGLLGQNANNTEVRSKINISKTHV